jgi:hypothetical protein
MARTRDDARDSRRANLRTLGFLLVPPSEPELVMLHRQLTPGRASAWSPWDAPLGWDLQLTEYGDGHWRATFYVTGLARAGRLDSAAATVASLHPPLERVANRCTHGRVVCFGVTHVDVQSNATVAEGKGLDGRDEARETSRQIVRPAYHLRVIAHAVFSPQS